MVTTKTRFTYKNPNITPLRYGREMEAHVAENVKEVISSEWHKNLFINQGGSFLNHTLTDTDASPDRRVRCECHKASYQEINVHFQYTIKASLLYLKKSDDVVLRLNNKHKYYTDNISIKMLLFLLSSSWIFSKRNAFSL